MYTDVVIALQKAFEILPEGVDLSKGGLGELALAHELGPVSYTHLTLPTTPYV